MSVNMFLCHLEGRAFAVCDAFAALLDCSSFPEATTVLCNVQLVGIVLSSTIMWTCIVVWRDLCVFKAVVELAVEALDVSGRRLRNLRR